MNRHNVVTIGNSIIWGLVIIGCSLALRGTGAYKEIQLILGAGAAFSLVLNGRAAKKSKDKLEA
ncbi:MAG: hypothetical protein K8S24_08185 [Candidatus Aegiribacteria sp.]|nr:hypothetical protein [Candidatus Aegiribacteria sp.]